MIEDHVSKAPYRQGLVLVEEERHATRAYGHLREIGRGGRSASPRTG